MSTRTRLRLDKNKSPIKTEGFYTLGWMVGEIGHEAMQNFYPLQYPEVKPEAYAELKKAGLNDAVLITTCGRAQLFCNAKEGELTPENFAKILGRYTNNASVDLLEQAIIARGIDAINLFYASWMGATSFVPGDSGINDQFEKQIGQASSRVHGILGETLGQLRMRGRLLHDIMRPNLSVGQKKTLSEDEQRIARFEAPHEGDVVAPMLHSMPHIKSVLIVGSGDVAQGVMRAYVEQEERPALAFITRSDEQRVKVCDERAYSSLQLEGIHRPHDDPDTAPPPLTPEEVAAYDAIIVCTHGHSQEAPAVNDASLAAHRAQGKPVQVVDLTGRGSVNVTPDEHVTLTNLRDVHRMIKESPVGRALEARRPEVLATIATFVEQHFWPEHAGFVEKIAASRARGVSNTEIQGKQLRQYLKELNISFDPEWVR